MKKTITTLTLMAFATGMAFAQAASPVINKKQVNQEARIAAGVKNGSLTKAEARRLQRQQNELRRDIRQDKRDGGKFTAAERADARQEQREQSRKITKQKNDAQVRPQ
jgi:hypothetical protein